jgi:hypothetical protein
MDRTIGAFCAVVCLSFFVPSPPALGQEVTLRGVSLDPGGEIEFQPVSGQSRNAPAATVDGGDFYWAMGRKIRLLRVADEVMVCFEPEADKATAVAALTGSGGTMAGYKESFKTRSNRYVLKANDASTADVPGRLQSLRGADNVKWAGPSFICAETNTRLWATNKVVVALEEGLDPKAILTGDFADYRRMYGRKDRYIVFVQGGSLESLSAAETLRTTKGIMWASPSFQQDYRVSTNDTLYSDLWYLDNGTDPDIEAATAWLTTTGSSDVVIAVLDNGVETTH